MINYFATSSFSVHPVMKRRLLPAIYAGYSNLAGDGAQRDLPNPYLLETMLRALHREPAQLGRVASLLDVLRKAPGSSELLSDDFRKVWEPIWDAARQDVAK